MEQKQAISPFQSANDPIQQLEEDTVKVHISTGYLKDRLYYSHRLNIYLMRVKSVNPKRIDSMDCSS